MPWFLRASLNCNLVSRSLLVAFVLYRYTCKISWIAKVFRCQNNFFVGTTCFPLVTFCNDQCMFKEVSLSWRHWRDSRYSSCGGVSRQNVGSCFASVMCPFMEDANGFFRFQSNLLGWMVDPSTAPPYEYINTWPSDIVQIAQCFPLHLYNSRLHWFYRIQSRSWWNRWRIAPQKPLDRHEHTFNNFRISAKKQFFHVFSRYGHNEQKNKASTYYVRHPLRQESRRHVSGKALWHLCQHLGWWRRWIDGVTALQWNIDVITRYQVGTGWCVCVFLHQ